MRNLEKIITIYYDYFTFYATNGQHNVQRVQPSKWNYKLILHEKFIITIYVIQN